MTPTAERARLIADPAMFLLKKLRKFLAFQISESTNTSMKGAFQVCGLPTSL